jgi:hypothetical protein
MSFIILPDELLIEIASWIGDIKGLVEFGLINRNCWQILTEDNHLRFTKWVGFQCMPPDRFCRLLERVALRKSFVEVDIYKLVNMIYLDCSWCNTTDESLSKLTKLTHLNCECCESITDKSLSELVNLEYLDCEGCKGVTDKSICKLVNLEFLDCGDCKSITDKSICKLKKLNQIYSCYSGVSREMSRKINRYDYE